MGVLANTGEKADSSQSASVDQTNQAIAKNADSVAGLQAKVDELTTSYDEKIAALQKEIESLSSRVENQTVISNKAMGRVSKRIANQASNTTLLEQSLKELSSDKSSIQNHTSTLDKAIVRQHQRHNELKSDMSFQRLELLRLKKINSQLAEFFESVTKAN